jgi:pseudouridine kinase
MIAIDANLGPRTLAAIFTLGRRYHVPICANPVSAGLAARLLGHLRDCAIVTPNSIEAQILTSITITDLASSAQAAQRLVSAGVGLAIITMGDEGVFYASKSGATGHVPAVRCEVVDSTGAGDALAAAVVYGLVNDFPVDEAIHLGVSSATMALSSNDTVNRELSLENLYQALAT